MSRVLFRLLCKLVQRQTYTCLSTRYGIVLCLGGLLLTLISVLQFGEVLIEWSLQKYPMKFNINHDNVGGRSYQERLCLPIPIDVVYTWVNGSDEKLIYELQKLKEKLDQENGTDDILNRGISKNDSTSKYAGRLLKKYLSSHSRSKGRADLDVLCTYADCGAARILVVLNSFKDQGLTLNNVRSLHPSFKVISKVQNSTSRKKDHIVLMYFPNAQSTHNALREKVKFQGANVPLFQGYFTTDSQILESMESKSEIIVTGFQKYTDLADLHKVLQQKYGKKLSDISYDPKKHIAIVYFADQTTAKSALKEFKGNYTVDGGATLKVSHAFLVWAPSWPFQDEPVNVSSFEEEDHVISANRFADNQELKYSLRSIEKFAPWVRNVYIVTNGQIPSWLNLDNPRVKIITHKDLFVNQSHLPTFSSPAIESHLHRIPGLSQKFIYMNDDVMFGDYVWPDDFYTHAKGQKLYLTWNVPNCNEGCPASWIQDKYCDKACNVSECDFDGGDCIGVKKGSRYSYQSWHQQQSRFRLDFCSTGCADTWVGDRYCDTACNVYKCGFDGGDCGISNYHNLYGVNIVQDNQEFTLPDGLQVVYFNLSKIFNDAQIVEAKHSENMIIRTAIAAQKPKLLTLTLRNNYTLTSTFFSITGSFNETKKLTINFNVTMQTTGTYEPTDKPSVSPTTQTNSNPTLPMLRKAKDFKTIQILYSNKSIINYWTAVNGSIPKPTWMEMNSDVYRVPHISNETVLPDNVHKVLQTLDRELKEGDITEKGYQRRKANILKNYLSSDGYHGNRIRTNQTTLPYKNKADKKQLKHPNKGEKLRPPPKEHPSQNHNRRLLSIDTLQEGQLTSHYIPVLGEAKITAFSSNTGELPSQDEIFLANWIADTKRKQLSYKDDLEKSLRAWRERYGDWDPLNHDMETSFLPWERQRVFEQLQTRQKQRRKYDYSTLGRRGRKLLDTFADSLLHVHRLYNRKFGYAGRKVPAHMPHMIDVQVMEELQVTFPEEFDNTSSHKLRSSDDMQFAFSYNYFVIGQTSSLNVTLLFAELDTDRSGALSDRELRTLATRLYPLPLSLSDLHKLEKSLINCSLGLDPVTEREKNVENHEPALPLVTESLLSVCTEVTKLLNESKGITKKYKHETVNDDDIWFKMITNNASLVLNQLDNVRARTKKFICLNDNIDHSQNATIVRALLVDFYKSFFPIPSQFELSANYRNRFLYVEDLNEWKRERKKQQERQSFILAGIALFLLVLLFWRKIVRFLKWLFPFRRRFIPSVSHSNNTRLLSI